MLNSEHMKWDGKWDEINTYCTSPIQSQWACITCHVSTGKVQNQTIADIDCLVCHNNNYQRSFVRTQGNTESLTNWKGETVTYNLPDLINGAYLQQPKPELDPVLLAQTVHLPDKASCLRCHAKAGGTDGAKRGDIYANLASANLSIHDDFHMSPDGANLNCQDCHVTGHDHKIPGRGIDLRISEGGTVSCTQCHAEKPHLAKNLNSHSGRIACQTCHIPTFGKNTSTEMTRDWRFPVWNPAGLGGQGAWIGEESRASNQIPSYTFWNGQSFIYDMADAINPEPDGTFTMAKALGGINDAKSKLYPIKVHTSHQPRDNTSGRMIAYDVMFNFMTGLFEDAANRGQNFMGLNGPYTWVNVRTEQLITHGVETKDLSLQCASCHSTRTQMDLRTMGYELKGPKNEVCQQCHGLEDDVLSFDEVHNEHVTGERIDCSMCHNFTRPERNLNIGIIRD